MKIERDGEKLIIKLPPQGDEKRRAFLYDTYEVLYQEWYDKNTPVFDTGCFGLGATAKYCSWIEKIARRHGFEITDEANALFEEIAKRQEQAEEEKLRREMKELARKKAVSLLHVGCGWCESLKWDGNRYICEKHDMPCVTSAEEVEWLFELWKETKSFRRPTPFPHKNCEELEVLR